LQVGVEGEITPLGKLVEVEGVGVVGHLVAMEQWARLDKGIMAEVAHRLMLELAEAGVLAQ
jgi:hypothetical protein